MKIEILFEGLYSSEGYSPLRPPTPYPRRASSRDFITKDLLKTHIKITGVGVANAPTGTRRGTHNTSSRAFIYPAKVIPMAHLNLRYIYTRGKATPKQTMYIQRHYIYNVFTMSLHCIAMPQTHTTVQAMPVKYFYLTPAIRT